MDKSKMTTPPLSSSQNSKQNIQNTLKKFNQLMRTGPSSRLFLVSSPFIHLETPNYGNRSENVREKDSSTSQRLSKEKQKMKPRDHFSGLEDLVVSFSSEPPLVSSPSEPIKAQEGNMHGRYGAYKIKDIIAFEEFMAR
jgi:hypothetical protein